MSFASDVKKELTGLEVHREHESRISSINSDERLA